MAANTIIRLAKKSQDGLVAFQKSCFSMLNTQWNLRENFRKVDLDYMRENDLTRDNQLSKGYNNAGDANKFQNVTIPIVLPAVEAAVVYQSSVFLSGTPIFEAVATPKYMDAALQFNAIIAENSVRGGWVSELQMHFRNGAKYNIAALLVDWHRDSTTVFDTDMNFAEGKQGKPRNIVWEGNRIKNLDMYNVFWDTRVSPCDVPAKGEFSGYTEFMSRIAFKNFLAKLEGKIIENVVPALQSGRVSPAGFNNSVYGSYYIPPLNPLAYQNIYQSYGTDWMQWVGMSGKDIDINYQNGYEISTMYVRILPSDFAIAVPHANTPQVWKLVIVNQSVVIYAERQTNAHDLLPILFSQYNNDGLSYQTKSPASNVTPIQYLTSALSNSVIHARRRSATDRVLFDPSRIESRAINADNPSAKIPVKPAAYGKPIAEAVYAFPFRDDQSSLIMQEIGMFAKLGDQINGINPVRQGQFVKGNKTKTEFSDVMNNANGRDQMTAMSYEAMLFTPLKNILKINTLQYQQPTSVYYEPNDSIVNVDPIALRKAVMEFKISDGLTPTSKLINGDSFATALQVIGSSPQIGAGYNIAPMFSYLMKTQGAILDEFEKSNEQVAYEQAMGQWSQLAQLAIEKGTPFNTPQPVPQQFGYLVNGELKQQNTPPENPLGTMLQSIASKGAAEQQQGAAQ